MFFKYCFTLCFNNRGIFVNATKNGTSKQHNTHRVQ